MRTNAGPGLKQGRVSALDQRFARVALLPYREKDAPLAVELGDGDPVSEFLRR